MFPASIIFGMRSLNANDDIGAVIARCAFFAVPSLILAVYLVRTQIVADAHGLTFQEICKSTFIPWSRIEDYELRALSSNKSKPGLPIAYLKVGERWKEISRSYIPYNALLERIAREAQWAKARKWQLAEIRSDSEWPKTFEYRDISGWQLLRDYLLFTFTFLGLNFLKIATYGWASLVSKTALIWSGLSVWERSLLLPFPSYYQA